MKNWVLGMRVSKGKVSNNNNIPDHENDNKIIWSLEQIGSQAWVDFEKSEF